MSGVTRSTRGSWRSKLSTYFEAHGRFCASHPWEVIVTTVTLTVSALSMSVLNGGKVGTVCGISKPCVESPEKSDTVLLSIVNCLAVIYIYNQFSKLRKAGSKYILGIAGLFTIFSSFVFGSTVINFIDDKVSGLHEALPFFLLLIDLSKASSLAKIAFKSRTKDEVRDNIGRGIAELGPTMSLDTLVEVLLISIGTISGVPQFETLCCFGSVSLIANYLVFMTFFPAALALFLEVCPFDAENPMWHLDELNREMEQSERRPNPVAQRVKVIMALGLAVVHIHSQFFSSMTGLSFGFSTSEGTEGSLVERPAEGVADDVIEKVPLNDYLWWKVFNMSVDQIVTVLLAAVLFVKYIFLDKSGSYSPSSVPPTPNSSRKNSTTTVFSKSKPIQSSSSQSGSCPFLPPSSRNLDFSPGSLNRRAADESMEKLVNNGIVITDTTRRPTTTNNTNTPSIDNVPAKLPSKSSPNKFDLRLKPVASVTVGTQTDFEDQPVKKSMFSLGDMSEPSTPTESSSGRESPETEIPAEPRPISECLALYKSDEGANLLSDEEIQQLVKAKHIPAYKLETALGDHQRGIAVRRQILEKQLGGTITLKTLPYKHYDFSLVTGACCENVIGYMPLPVGYAGPLLLDDKSYHVPMSTTEGALVASTNRGCRALSSSGGVRSMILDDGMTRGPVLRCPSAVEAGSVKVWFEDRENFDSVAEVFNSTSRFARLKAVQVAVAGRLLYIRFKAFTGDAMGMNMLSKGVEKSLSFVTEKFPNLEVISLSGNYCTDKKPAAINWIEGRGKSVVCEATIPSHIVKQVLKTNVDALVDLNISKNLVGSAMAGAIGGFNAHAANVVTAIYIATGQDPAQNIASSNCITLMERSGSKGEDLYISCTMPSIEIGTVGGGTILGPQSACLSMVGVKGPNKDTPGDNAKQLARIVCATVLAGELSLLSALAAGHLVKSHLTHNRSNLNLASIPESAEPKEHRRTRSDTTSMTHQTTPSSPVRRASAAGGTAVN